MFSEIYFGNSLEEWIISLLIIVCSLILNKGIILVFMSMSIAWMFPCSMN